MAPSRAMPRRSPSAGHFESGTHSAHLLEIVRTVALEATDGDFEVATRLSKSAWERAARAHAPWAPRAEAIRQRIGATWSEVLKQALGSRAEWNRVAGQRSKRGPRTEVADLKLLNALRRVARELGQMPTCTSYESTRQHLARDGRANLPGIARIVTRYGSLGKARDAAGLTEDAYPWRTSPRHGNDAASPLDRYIDETGQLPGYLSYRAWCAAKDIPIARHARDHWADYRDAVCTARRTRGEYVPDAVTPTKDAEAIPAPAPHVRRRHRRCTHQQVLDSLRRFGELHMPPGGLPRTDDYEAAAQRDPQLVHLRTVLRRGRWLDLCFEAGLLSPPAAND